MGCSGFGIGLVLGCSTHTAFVVGRCGGGRGVWRHGFVVVGHVSANSRVGPIVHAGLYGLCQLVSVWVDVGCVVGVVGVVSGGQSIA